MILQGEINTIKSPSGTDVIALNDLPIAEYLLPLNGKDVKVALLVLPDAVVGDDLINELDWNWEFAGKLEVQWGITPVTRDDDEEIPLDELVIPPFEERATVNGYDLLEVFYNNEGLWATLVVQEEQIDLRALFAERQTNTIYPSSPINLQSPFVRSDTTLSDIVYELALNLPVLYQDKEYRVVDWGYDDVRFYSYSNGIIHRLDGNDLPKLLVNRLARKASKQNKLNRYTLSATG